MCLTPFIKKEDLNPIYLQIYQYFREKIENGELSAGTKLPSIRQLSQSTNVSKNTVELAYQQLVAEGYIEGREKKGLFVLKLDDYQFPIGENISRTTLKYQKDEKIEKKFIDFHYGDIDLEHFPHKTWKKCLVDALEIPSQEVFSYGNKKGHLGLRNEIVQYLFQARGVQCSPDQIVLTAGTQIATQLLCQLLSLRNNRVALENPGYDGVRHVFESQQCKIKPVSLKEDGICIEELENSSARCAYVTPSHQFPMGMVLPIQKRIKLLQWAEENSSYIIEDDYDGEFRYQGQPIPSLKSLDTNGNVIYLGTFSKAFLPAARVSYLVLPEKLLERFQSEFNFYNQAVSPFIQEALFQLMKNGHFNRHIRKMRKIYQSKQKVLLEAIRKFLGEDVQVIGQKAGLHLLLNFNKNDPINLVKQAEKLGVKIYLTEPYWYQKTSGSNQPIIIGFGGLSEADIQAGIQKLAIALKKY
ncbi:hypothetical protein BIV60_14350 [Bacillus sp. MUM 116]|uniref:MocR-like pyridoxine biosynthesis transcription factor PdxR n=1 Tax=Bacillus sp. MUM 116 TaxID=1678002 RepID=UPI0008F5589F|nr:PLP-dependent aminotransferase family protein [Bacillus sp. MUM 116]OIK13267.1 hypothetical protein BIV60_14350 [Bacillus sp. MUM 116]